MFEIRETDFYLEGKPFKIYSGAIHYFRTVPQYWEDRLLKLKLAGFNTVETYVCWNLHEKKKGQFDFEGILDLERFLSIAQDLGLYAILRPAPYICAEWDLGGLPAWLLAEPDMPLRCNDPVFMGHVRDYYRVLIPKIARHQLDRGGNVLMVQIENEYGSYGNDKEYLRANAALLREFGITMPLFTSDGPTDHMLSGGTLPEYLPVANFGSKARQCLTFLNDFRPGIPLMCGEFWDGWFDHWGEAHHTRQADTVEAEIRDFIDMGASFNFYMFEGGTNFGFTAGANHAGGQYQPTVTSYDYGAMLNEWGKCTPKYHAIRKILLEATGQEALPLPEDPKLQNIGPVTLTAAAPLLSQIKAHGLRHDTVTPRSLEQLGHANGLMLYCAHMQGPNTQKNLTIDGLHDRAHVYLNGAYCGTVYRNDEKQSVTLPDIGPEGADLEILVEGMGRVNYGEGMFDRKGITGAVRSGKQYQFHWQTYVLALDSTADLTPQEGAKVQGPAVLRGHFHADSQADCFVHMKGFAKGIVFINGFNLGRYWKIGPQQSLYLPGPLLKEENEIVVIELDEADTDTLTIADWHDLG